MFVVLPLTDFNHTQTYIERRKRTALCLESSLSSNSKFTV